MACEKQGNGKENLQDHFNVEIRDSDKAARCCSECGIR
jgi:hypothetical protein